MSFSVIPVQRKLFLISLWVEKNVELNKQTWDQLKMHNNTAENKGIFLSL